MHLEPARRPGLGERLQRRRLFNLPQDKKPVLTADGEGAMAAHLMPLDTAIFSAAATLLLSPVASHAIARSRNPSNRVWPSLPTAISQQVESDLRSFGNPDSLKMRPALNFLICTARAA